MADYKVTSDNSYMPYQDITESSGLNVNGQVLSTVVYRHDDTQDFYFRVMMMKSDTSYKYNRSVQKISTVFSYIGGFYGAISAAFFFLRMYTDDSY